MRVLTINTTGTVHGGAGGVFVSGARLLAQRGHEVACMAADVCEVGEEQEAVRRYLLAGRGTVHNSLKMFQENLYSGAARRLVRRALVDFKPDVAHIHTIHGVFSPSILLDFKKAGVPVVQTLHDYRLICPARTFLSHNHICEACKGKRYYRCLTKRCGGGRSLLNSAALMLINYVNDYIYHYERLIDAFISPSHFLKQKMIENGYSKNKFHVLHNAYFYRITQEHVGPRQYVLFVGRLSPEKGIDLLIEAAKGLKVPVKIVGDGPARPALETQSRYLKLDNVQFLGFQRPERVTALYQGAIVNVLPSRWYENGPLVILEAYAHETPVVGANIGAIPEFIAEGKTGRLFEADNAASLHQVLADCLAHPEDVRAMGRSAREHVIDQYSPENYVQGLESILERVIA